MLYTPSASETDTQVSTDTFSKLKVLAFCGSFGETQEKDLCWIFQHWGVMWSTFIEKGEDYFKKQNKI